MNEEAANRGWQVEAYWDDSNTLWSDKLQDQVLENIKLVGDEAIRLQVNGKEYDIWDSGQSCCEHRYITSDDDLASFTGGTLNGVVLGEYRSVDPDPDEDRWNVEDHNASFLRVYTSRGVIVFETHVEHNGYYGRFSVQLREV